MQKSHPVSFLLVFAAGVVAACDNGNANSTPSDAASEATVSETGTVDTGRSEAGADVTTEGAADAPIDSPVDRTTMDVSVETGVGSSDGGSDSPTDAPVVPPGVVALPGYTVTVFATGGTTYSHPDSLELDGTHVWVGYNMGVAKKDGTDGGAPYNSMVVQYNLDGTPTGQSFVVPGHCDGVRVDPATHLVWATSNEDGNPILMSYNPATPTTAAVTYTFANQPGHGGGLDDLAFINGQMVVADSSPTATDAGIISVPVLSRIQVSGTMVTFTPILMGNAMAHNAYSMPDSGLDTLLNLTDPDSMSIDDKGNLVLVDQSDSEILVISNPVGPPDGGIDGGDAGGAQSVTVYPVSTQLDDTVWATKATGMLLVADETANTIYAVHSTFTPGTVYTETPNDSSVPGIVATLDLAGQPQPTPTQAAFKPIVLGLKKPTGMIFVPQ